MNLSTQKNNRHGKFNLTTSELCIFAMFGALMYSSKIIMEAFPNIHLLAMFTMTFTLVYRAKALFPIYIYVFINGLFAGFATWWIPHLYLWTILWGITMLLPKKIETKYAAIIYPIICALHGLSYGTLYAPVQALVYGLSFDATIAWIIAGLPFDIIHCVGDFFAGLLILPLGKMLRYLNRQISTY